MAKNRKNQSAAIRFGPVLKAILLCLLVGGSGVGYVWQKSQILQLSDQIKARERRLSELRLMNERLQKQLGTMRSPSYLELQNKQLGLVPPVPSQIWRLPEPAPEPSPAAGQRQVALQNRAAPTGR